MNVDEALKVADSRRTPAEQYSERMAVEAHALVALAAEVRRLRDENDALKTGEPIRARDDEIARLRAREAKARELATWTIDAAAGCGNGPWIRREWSRWLAEGNDGQETD